MVGYSWWRFYVRFAWQTVVRFALPLALVLLIPTTVGFILLSKQDDKIKAAQAQIRSQQRTLAAQQATLEMQQEALKAAQKAIAQFAVENRQLALQGRQAHDGICAVRANLIRRVEATEEYLRKHPEGIAGVDAETIRKSEADQRQTIEVIGKSAGCVD